MPIYEYTCDECDNRFEKFVRTMTTPLEVKCPKCGSLHVRKGWSVFGTSGGNGSAGSFSASAGGCNTGGT